MQNGEANSGPHSHITGRKETHVLIGCKCQIPSCICLQAISWVLDGSDLEIQATQIMILDKLC